MQAASAIYPKVAMVPIVVPSCSAGAIGLMVALPGPAKVSTILAVLAIVAVLSRPCTGTWENGNAIATETDEWIVSTLPSSTSWVHMLAVACLLWRAPTTGANLWNVDSQHPRMLLIICPKWKRSKSLDPIHVSAVLCPHLRSTLWSIIRSRSIRPTHSSRTISTPT